MTIKELWPAFGIPAIGAVMGVYHKYIINPRLTKVEDETTENTKILTEVKTDVKWVVKTLNREFNGKK